MSAQGIVAARQDRQAGDARHRRRRQERQEGHRRPGKRPPRAPRQTASGAAPAPPASPAGVSSQVKSTATSATQTGDKTVTQLREQGQADRRQGQVASSRPGLTGTKAKMDAHRGQGPGRHRKIPGENQGKVSQGQAKVNAEASKEPPKKHGGLGARS